MKFVTILQVHTRFVVAPLVGAWIEISVNLTKEYNTKVAPLVGAWIEIFSTIIDLSENLVAPLVGAWIEIYMSLCLLKQKPSRSSCRSVD